MSEKERNDAKKGENKDKPGHGKRILLRTFGCQMNERDSELVTGLFLEKGYKLAVSPDEADVILFNTCSVRNHAEHRAISNMGALLKRKAAKRKAATGGLKIYGIIGCTAQALKKELFKMLPELDIVCGTGDISKLPKLVEEAKDRKVLALGNADKFLPDKDSSYRKNKSHAYVSIMRGCDNFCSYCIVPYVRGRERSRKVSDIVLEIENLAKRGIKEITLLGQNVNSYRDGKHDFADLLKILNKIECTEVVSFLTSHPKDAHVNLFEALRDLDKIKKHLHLPLQSGSDEILKAMNRGYTAKKYLSLANKARDIVPGLRLTTDIIVGFPGETDIDFKDTLDLMKEIKFNAAYIFKYSPREGTKAAGMNDDIPEDIKKKRHNKLLTLQKEISNEKNNCSCHN